jgi:hypothetical protein
VQEYLLKDAQKKRLASTHLASLYLYPIEKFEMYIEEYKRRLQNNLDLMGLSGLGNVPQNHEGGVYWIRYGLV